MLSMSTWTVLSPEDIGDTICGEVGGRVEFLLRAANIMKFGMNKLFGGDSDNKSLIVRKETI